MTWDGTEAKGYSDSYLFSLLTTPLAYIHRLHHPTLQHHPHSTSIPFHSFFASPSALARINS
ncbi:hypothetical protein K457DRAFT_1496081 [Linnemannia elongata AG-77]|uniref:Uncharacterized protein n=1 Tax=Linnemannia elongata AG-77 TaxID=1314771 RepID=A0A197KC27_9FUNG|nr:hypothetical protein K457DRAFT_1496081 [Linnemannia elongata AG-77]